MDLIVVFLISSLEVRHGKYVGYKLKKKYVCIISLLSPHSPLAFYSEFLLYLGVLVALFLFVLVP